MNKNTIRLIVDANIIFSALVKDSVTRKLIIEAPIYFYTPDILMEEINKNIGIISKKTGLTPSEIKQVLKKILKYIAVVNYNIYEPGLQKAIKIMKDIDIKDSPYIALALSFKNNGIWSEDRHMIKQDVVKVWTTVEVIKLIR